MWTPTSLKESALSDCNSSSSMNTSDSGLSHASETLDASAAIRTASASSESCKMTPPFGDLAPHWKTKVFHRHDRNEVYANLICSQNLPNKRRLVEAAVGANDQHHLDIGGYITIFRNDERHQFPRFHKMVQEHLSK